MDAIIRTSDRVVFKRCRRKWSFSSNLHHNRTQSESASFLWIGTACHYALEDYHGYNYYKHPVEAFRALVHAQRIHARNYPDSVKLPIDIDEQVTLGEGLLDYYLVWLKHREHYPTYWVDGVPQVEVRCEVELPIDPRQINPDSPYDRVVYQATLDRVVEIDNELWVMDYKFYNRDWTPEPDYDAQMSAYIWIAHAIYDKPIRGAILQKHFKRIPENPRIKADGKISTDKNQNTTYHMYKEVLEGIYGTVSKAPLANRKCLEELAAQESVNRDNYIRRDKTERNEHQVQAIGSQILLEVADMINPDLPLYKNDTKDCSWDCSFKDICIAMDSGYDWESILKDTTVSRVQADEGWRKYLPHNDFQGEV